MIKVLLPILLCFCFQTSAQTFQKYFNEAKQAYKIGDYKTFYSKIQEAHSIHPYHQIILYQAGVAAALNNEPVQALAYLNRAIQIKADLDLNIPDLKNLFMLDGFAKLRELQATLQTPVIRSDTAFIVNDRSLHIECIAAGEKPGVFYLGSIHKKKIIRTDERGKIFDFTQGGQDGLTSVFGIKVDRLKKVLWACASPIQEMEDFDSTAKSAVFKYDLESGKLLSKYHTGEKDDHIFGDLTLDPEGNVFLSDSKNNVVYKVNESKGVIEKYFESTEFWNLQGITFSADGETLFIADYVRGIFRLDIKTKNLTLLTQQFGESLKSIDGLTFYNNKLIAIQNMIVPMRVTAYQLDNEGNVLTDLAIIDRAHPAFNEPTIGCVSGEEFYYVANSLWSGYDENRKLKPVEQLQPVVILKADLNRLK